MFGHIKGKIIDIKPTRVIVDVHGLGFSINCTPITSEKTRLNNESDFWVHTAVRENSIDLYGFETEDELKVFELLLTVSGVGPKSALAILGVAGVSSIEQAVATGDTSSLTKISGIGRKTAEKIVVELNGKLVSRSEKSGAIEDVDVFEALKSLGYRDRDIQDVIKSMPKEISGTNEKIKHALKHLGK